MILQYLFLNATPKFFMFPNLPKFQAMHQQGHDTLRRDMTVVPLHYTARAEKWPKKHTLTVEAINGSYIFRLHSSNHQAVYMRRGNFIPVAYIFIYK